MKLIPSVVVPFLFLVWYNRNLVNRLRGRVVVPFLFLVWYNFKIHFNRVGRVVVPFLFLVWYNGGKYEPFK